MLGYLETTALLRPALLAQALVEPASGPSHRV